MAKFRQVYTEFWTDPKVIEEMSPEDKFFMLYLLTNSSTTQIGIYQITKKQMAFETGYSIETINSLIHRFENVHENIKYNTETREIAIKNWGRYNFFKGGKPVYDLMKSEMENVKDVSLLAYIFENYLNIPKVNINIVKLFEEFFKKHNILCESHIDTCCASYDDTSPSRITIGGQEEEEEEEVEEEKEEEKEEDIEKEKEEDVEEINKKTSAAATFSDVISVFNNNIHMITPVEGQKLSDWSKDMENEVLIKAIEEAVYYSKRNMGYINAILNSWHGKNIKTTKDVEAYFRDRTDKKGGVNESHSRNNQGHGGSREEYDFSKYEV